jgi:hypothetical protein
LDGEERIACISVASASPYVSAHIFISSLLKFKKSPLKMCGNLLFSYSVGFQDLIATVLLEFNIIYLFFSIASQYAQNYPTMV